MKDRKRWLRRYLANLRPLFKAAGYELSSDVRVEFAHSNIRGTKRSFTLAHTWRDGAVRRIELSPRITEAMEVGAVLVHELCHDIADQKSEKHTHRSRAFRDAHARMGLVGAATGSVPSPELQVVLAKIITRIGGLPSVV